MSPNAKGAIYALLGFALFSAHDVIVKYLGGNYSTFQILFFSVLFSFPMVLTMHLRERSSQDLIPKHPWWSTLRVLATVITGISAFYAFSVLPMAQVYAFLFCMPLVITVLSIPILSEKVGIHRGGAVIVGLIGVMIVLRPGSTEFTLGHIAALTAAMFGGLGSLIVRKIGKDERNIVLLLYPMFASLLLMGALMPPSYVPLKLLDLGALALMAILASTAQLCIILAYKSGEAAVVAPMHYSQMIWAIIYGFFIFQEWPDAMTLIGSLVIIASGSYVVFRESRKKVSQNTPVLRNRSRADTGTVPRISFLDKTIKS
jgi:drug/metabolite transporter (DMT)-like permease